MYGRHQILACVDVLLDDLMGRTAKSLIQVAYSTIFVADTEGTLIYHPEFVDAIKSSEGKASLQSLRIESDYPLLKAVSALVPGKATIVRTKDDIVVLGKIPGTPWVLSEHYPRVLMTPDVYRNLAIVVLLGGLTLLVGVFILCSVLQNQVAKPLYRLINAARSLGASKARVDKKALPTESLDEVGMLARDFLSMAERVQNSQEQLASKIRERTAALEEANRQLIALSTADGLTGIANRRHFDSVLDLEWQRALRAGKPLAVAMIDVDWFKEYNDHYGHQAGDDCLRNIAEVLKAQASRAGDMVARYGGEEFVFLSVSTEAADALRFADCLCAALHAHALQHVLSPLGFVTVSVGVAVVVPAEGGSPEQLLKSADDALYRAKVLGRNHAVVAE